MTGHRNKKITTAATGAIRLLLLLLVAGAASAQPQLPELNPMTAQCFESRKGYMASIPAEAVLDSASVSRSPLSAFPRTGLAPRSELATRGSSSKNGSSRS